MLESPVEVKSGGPGSFPTPGRSPTPRSRFVTHFMSVSLTWLLQQQFPRFSSAKYTAGHGHRLSL